MRGSACNPRWNARGPGWRPFSRHAVAWPLLPTPLRRKRLRVCCCKLAASPPLTRRPPSLPRLLCKTRSSLRSSVRVVASLRDGDGDSVPQTSDAALGPLRSVSLPPPRYRGSSSAHRRCRLFGAPWRGRADLWSAFPSAGIRTLVLIPRFAAPLCDGFAVAASRSQYKSRCRWKCQGNNQFGRVPGRTSARLVLRTRGSLANKTVGPRPRPCGRAGGLCDPGKDVWAGVNGWSCESVSRTFPRRRPLFGAKDGPAGPRSGRPHRRCRDWGSGLSAAPGTVFSTTGSRILL